jgi:tetratricopeptide (TPR) repeat protein
MSSQELRVSMPGGKLLALAYAASLVVALPCAAQYGQGPGTQKPPQQQPPKQNPPPKAGQPDEKAPGKSTEAPPVNKEEEDAAKALFALKSDQAPLIIQSGEDFLQKYSLSRYRASAYFRLAQAYLDTGKDDKLVSTGDRALAENPDNVDVLSLMAWYLPHRIDRKALDAEQKLDKAEKYGRHCLELIATMAKPEGVTDEDFERAKRQKQGMAHSGLGWSISTAARTRR